MLAIIKKELKGYFLSPIGYVAIGIFLFIFSFFFLLEVMNTATVNLGYLYFSVAVYGLLIMVPVLTMRLFADERKSGTEQLLLTSPLGIFKIVMGKFLSAFFVILITLLISFMYYAIIAYLGKPNLIMTLVQMLGFALVGMAGVSIGMFASSLTENQFVAGLITAVFLLISLFITQVSQTLSVLSFVDFYRNFAMGIISVETIISLLLFTFVFIALTIIVMQRRKLVK